MVDAWEEGFMGGSPVGSWLALLVPSFSAWHRWCSFPQGSPIWHPIIYPPRLSLLYIHSPSLPLIFVEPASPRPSSRYWEV